MLLKGNPNPNPATGRLISTSFPDTSGSCIRWYMILENQATLSVRTYAFGALNPTVLYTIQGSTGKQWKLAQTTVRRGAPYQVAFEGTLNNTQNVSNSVAIDDVEIRSGVCDDIGSCDFERGLCGFQTLPADFEWKRTSYNVEVFSAPLVDHTTNSRAGTYDLWLG